jgi:hypothetical protein
MYSTRCSHENSSMALQCTSGNWGSGSSVAVEERLLVDDQKRHRHSLTQLNFSVLKWGRSAMHCWPV